MKTGFRRYLWAIAATAIPVILAGGVYWAAADRDGGGEATAPTGQTATLVSAPELIEARCGACHAPDGEGGFDRISTIRKTPEGWDMTLTRMTIWHRVSFDADERRIMVKYLADHLGLAPSEAAPYRYALEQDYNRVEDIADADIGVFCARCHSYARIALQRRDEDEWRKLAHTHMGQYPSMEHQEKARNEEHYWQVMRDKIPVRLDVLYPFTTEAWTRWSAAEKPSPAGHWRIAGRWPGAGRYTGTADITALGDDRYRATYVVDGADGDSQTGNGTAILYTGYEWRGASGFGDHDIREVFALSADGQRLTGRWYLADQDERGASFTAVRVNPGDIGIIAVEPPYIKAGAQATITVHGYGLSGDLSLGPGVEVGEIIARTPDAITLRARAGSEAAPGPRVVTVGATKAGGLFALYHAIAGVHVEPVEAIARVGGGGGSLRKVAAQFDAIAYADGGDGVAGSDDDFRLGSMPAQWSVDNFSAVAVAEHDIEFAGAIDQTGLFTPAEAGVNPARAAYSRPTNNAGDLAIIATLRDGDREVVGRGHLIVTVQRWVRPPIR